MKIISTLIMVVSMVVMSVAANAATTYHGKWTKPVYSVGGSILSVETMRYDLQVPDKAHIGRIIEVMSPVIGMTSLQGRFSNLEEFQIRVNEKLREIGAPYQNFVIVDIYVDER